MSQTIENRIVEMQFENKQFESGVQQSLSTLDKLKKSLKFDDTAKDLQNFSDSITKNLDMNGIGASAERLKDRFSASGIAGMEVIRKLTDFAIEAGAKIANALDAPFAQIRSGGWKRAMNIEDAKFQLKGLGIAWESVASDIDFAVSGTAFGLDAAAKACGQLSASGIQAGNDMKYALRGISGVAAMGNTEFENITDIFTKVAGNGRVMATELNRVSQYGLNARSALVDFFNDINTGADKLQKYEIPETVQEYVKSITDGTTVIESDINDLVRKGEVDFKTFAYAMDYAFGEHAKAANETFMGSLRNIKAALSKIGAEFATPIIQGAIPVFNEIRIFLNDLRGQMKPVFETFKGIAEVLSDKLTNKLRNFRLALLGENGFGEPMKNLMDSFLNIRTAIVRIIAAIIAAYKSVFPETKNISESLKTTTGFISKLTEALIPSNGALVIFSNIMRILFTVLKSVGSVLSNIVPIISQVLSVVSKIISAIATLAGYLLNLIMNLTSVQNLMLGIQNAGGLFAYVIERLKDAFYYLKDVLTDTTTVTGRFFTSLKEGATVVAFIVGGSLYLAFTKIKEVVSHFDAHDPLGSLITAVKTLISHFKELPVIKDLISGLEIVFGAVSLAISKAVDFVVDFVSKIREGQSVFEALSSTAQTAISTIISGFNKLSDTIRNWFSTLMGGEKVIEETVESPIYGANMAMDGMVKELVATGSQVEATSRSFDDSKKSITGFGATFLDVIRNFDYGKLILSAYAAMLLIITFNSNKLIIAITSLANKLSGGFFNIFKTGKTKFEKFAHGIILITGSIMALSGAVYVLSKVPVDRLNAVTNSLLKLIGLIGGLSILSTILTTFALKSNTSGFTSFSTSMFMIASGIIALVGALKLLETVKLTGKELWEKVGVIGAMAVGLATISGIMSALVPQLTKGSLFMVAFAASTLILVKALEDLSKISLDGLSANWETLTAIILAFAGFAALAGTVGVTSVVSMVGFLLSLRILIKNIDPIMNALKEHNIGAALVGLFEGLKEDIKKAVDYVNNLSTGAKVLVGILGGAFLTACITIAIILRRVEAAILKAAVSAGVIAISMAALMYATLKIAESCKGISSDQIKSAIAILITVGGLIGAVLWLMSLFEGDTTHEDIEHKGLFKRGRKTSSDTRNRSNSIKQARKMLLDMAVLLASIALFVNVVGKLTPAELAQATSLLQNVMVFIGILMVVITLITAFARNSGNAGVSVAVFIGVIGTIGALLGSFVILMNLFKNFNWQTQKAQLIATISALIVIVIAVMSLIITIRKRTKQISSIGTLLSFAAILGTVGYVVYQLMNVVKNSEDLKRAGAIAGGLAAFLLIMTILINSLAKTATILSKSPERREAFNKELLALGEMIIGIVLIGGILMGLQNGESGGTRAFGDSGSNVMQNALTLIGVLAALVALVRWIQKFSKETKTSITKKSWDNIKKTFLMIGSLIAAMAVLAVTFKILDGIGIGQMAAQAGILIAALIVLSGLAVGLIQLVKKIQTSWSDLGKAGTIIGGMIVAFTAMALVFKYILNMPDPSGILVKSQIINLAILELEALAIGLIYLIKKLEVNWGLIGEAGAILSGMIVAFTAISLVFKYILDMPDPSAMLAKSQIINLAILELEVLAVGLIYLIEKLEIGWGNIAKAGVILAGMMAAFAAIGLIFKYILDMPDPSAMLAKSQIVALALTELLVLGIICGKLSSTMLEGLAGDVGLIAMVGIFAVLVQVFKAIDNLKTEGIMAKSQTIILVLTELVGLAVLCGVLSELMIVAVIGGIGLIAIVGVFAVLVQVFKAIDDLKTEGIMAKSQTIILVLTELCGLSVLSILGAIAIVGAPGLLAMVGIFALLTQVFKVIQTLELEGLREKAHVIVLVLLELERLSVLSILSTIALAGAPGLAAMVEVFKLLAEVFLIIDTMHLEGMEEKANIIVNTLLRLEGLSAIGGLIGTVLGPGLLVFAEGLMALGAACDVIGGGVMTVAKGIDLLAISITNLTSTGTGIASWFTSISVGVTTLATTIMTVIVGLSLSIFTAVNNIITGVATAITNGGSIIFGAVKGVFAEIKEEITSTLNPFEWGKELVEQYANGINSNHPILSAAADGLAKVVWSYLHFSEGAELSWLKKGNVRTWGSEIPEEYATGISSKKDFAGLAADGLAKTVAEKLNIPPDKVKEVASNIGSGFVGWIKNSMLAEIPGLESIISQIEGLFAQVKMDYSRGAGVLDAYTPQIRKNIRETTESIARAKETIAKTNPHIKGGSQAIEEAKKVIEKLQPELDANRKLLGDIKEGTVGASEATKDFTEDLKGLGEGGGSAAGGVAEANDAIADFYDMIDSSISLFDKFEEAEEMSTSELLENMASQITGLTNWSNQIQELASKGIDQGLLHELANMGPSGQKYVKAFVNMTADELAQANNLYQQSLLLPQHVTAQVFGSFEIAGQNATEGFVNGLNHDAIREQGIAFAHSFLDNFRSALGIHSPSTEMADAAYYTWRGWIDMTKSSTIQESIRIVVEGTARSIIEWFSEATSEEKVSPLGRDFITFINNGLKNSEIKLSLLDTIKSLCREMINTAKSEFSSNSGGEEVGGQVVQDMAKGISDKTSVAVNAVGKSSDKVIEEMRHTISAAANSLTDEVNEPVIKPVLDLSEIERGSKDLDSMISRNKALSASNSFRNLQNQQWSSQSALLNATMDNTNVVNAIGSLSDDVISLREAMSNIKMVLDTGTLVGAMTPAVDKHLGIRKMYAERGM